MSRVQAILDRLASVGVHVTGLANDSRKVRAGDVFLAYPGGVADGRRYMADAVARGAVAVVAEAGPQVDAGKTALGVPVIATEGLAALCGELAAEVHGHPSRRLFSVGITGTNGKTSTAQWIAQALSFLGETVGVIGTLGNGIHGALAESPNTTPDPLVLQAALADFVAQGASACAMEVSSIGIEEQRTNGMHFDVAAFTNLTQDHLDYHGSMERYAEAKARLFTWPGLKAAVINADDPFGWRLLENLPSGVRRIACTLEAAPVPGAEVLRPEAIDLAGQGVAFTLDGVRFTAPVVGRFNIANLLAVIGVLQVKGYPLARCAEAIAAIVPPPGRMQAVGGDGEPLVVVDYAHTPDALEKALEVLREAARARGGRLHCVFGCGGDRDATKRPLMGAAASRLADCSLVTSDNPRSESPEAIIAQVLAGMPAGSAHEADRAEAIAQAIGAAGAADVVLIAGKGHEPYQEIAGVRHPFSDIEVAKSTLARSPWRR